MQPEKNGLFFLKTAKETGLPIFDFTIDDTPGMPIIFSTYTELQKYGLKLSKEQRETMIRGFLKTSNRMKGYAALYDLCEILEVFFGYKPIYVQTNK